MKKQKIVTALLILGITAANASQATDTNSSNKENIKTTTKKNQNIDIQKEIYKIMKIVKEIYKLKPDLIIDYDTICKFGGNCKQGANKYFKDIGFTELTNAKESEIYLNKLKDKKLLVDIIPNIKRTIIMLKYSIQTKTYPNTNGKMDAKLFDEL